MIKKLLISLLLVIFIGCATQAKDSDSFKIDKEGFRNEFTDINRLEQIILDNSFMPLSELKQNNLLPEKWGNFGTSQTFSMEPALGIPGFFWGCVLGPIGILCAYVLSDNNKAEAKSALTGCIVVYGLYGIVMAVLILTAETTTY